MATTKPKILVDAYGSRYYPEAVLCSILGISPTKLRELVRSGVIPPGVPRSGGKLYWDEATVSALERQSKASPVFPYSY